MITTTLTWAEASPAAQEGVQRRLRAMAKGRKLPGGWSDQRRGNRWENDIESACAERAVAKALNLYWPQSAMPDYAGDLPGGVQVRYVQEAHHGLLVYPTDPDDHKCVLVRGECPTYTLVGWITAAEGKRIGVPGNFERGAKRVSDERLRDCQELCA